MPLSLHLLDCILNRTIVAFGGILTVMGLLFVLTEHRMREISGAPGAISGEGRVIFIDVDGGFWGIVGMGREGFGRWEIHNDSFFPDEFHVNNLPVEFSGYRHNYYDSTHQWGMYITLTDIKKIQFRPGSI